MSKKNWYDDMEIKPNGGLFSKVEKVNNFEPFETLEEMTEALEEMFSRPQRYSGTTVCGKVWYDTKRHAVVTCDFDNCKTCKEFNEMLLNGL